MPHRLFDECPPDKQRDAFLLEQTRLLYASLPTALAINIILALILLSIQYFVIEFSQVIIWVSTVAATVFGRFVLLLAWRHAGNSSEDCLCWLRRFRIGVIASGAAWGLAALLLFPHGDLDHQSYLSFVLAGLGAGAVSTLSVDRVSIFGFLTPMLLPLAMHFWQEGGQLALAMGAMVILFLVFMMLNASRVLRNIQENINLRLTAEAQERLLRESESRLKEAQHTAQLGNWELDLKANQLYWSDEIFHIFEIDPSAFGASYEAFLNAIHPDDREAVNRAYTNSLEVREPYEITHRLLMGDGRVKWVIERCDTSFDADGKPLRSVGTVQDVTEKQLAENALRENEARYRAVTQSASDAIITADSSGNIVDWNRGAEVIFGYTKAEVTGKSLTLLMPNRYRDSHRVGMARLQAEGQFNIIDKGPIEVDGLRKDGREFPLEIALSTWESCSDRYYTGVIRDISDRKRAEEEKSELQFNQQALLNAIQESTFLLQRDGKVLVVNEVGARRLNMSPTEIVGKNMYDLLPTEVSSSRQVRFENIARMGKPETFEDHRADIHFMNTVYPVFGADGKVTRFAVYGADVTRQRQVQAIEDLFAAINQRVLSGLLLSELLQFICDAVARQFDLSLIWLGRKEQDGAVTVMTHSGSADGYVEHLQRIGVRWDDSPLGRGGTGMAIRSGYVQLLSPSYPGFRLWREVAEQYGFQSMMAVPLLIRGEVYGAFTLYSRRDDAFDKATAELLENVAARISVALETAMDQQQIRLLSSALAAAGNGVMVTNLRGIIQWVNPAFERLSGYSKEELIGKTPNILKSGHQDKEYYRNMWITILKGKNWCDETVERSKDGGIYHVSQTITPMLDDEGKITHFISIHEDITAQKKAQEHIVYMAHYDGLTGLPNRTLFYDRLRSAILLAKRNRGGLALMFLDLDGFKQVNDTQGHQAGDMLLIAVAERLGLCVRESDTVARLGGDEFTVILNDAHDQVSVSRIADKIIETISQPFDLNGQTVNIGVSIGIARYSEDAADEDSLVKKADGSMYEAKSAGKNTWRFA